MITKSSIAVSFPFTTHNADGEATHADSLPTAELYVGGTLNAAAITITELEGAGKYTASLTTPGSLADYIGVYVVATATIDGVTANSRIWEATVIAAGLNSVSGRYDDEEAEFPNITCKVGETGVEKSVTVSDAEGEPVDLTDWGDKQLVIEKASPPRTDVQVVANGNIAISGDSNSVFTFQPSSAVLEMPGDFRWSLREVSTGDVIIEGRLTVSYSPMEDEE